MAMIRALAACWRAKLDAVNKDNLTPLLLAEKPKKPNPNGIDNDPDVYQPKRDSREEVVASLRELMHLGPNDPAPQPPPLPAATTRRLTTRRPTNELHEADAFDKATARGARRAIAALSLVWDLVWAGAALLAQSATATRAPSVTAAQAQSVTRTSAQPLSAVSDAAKYRALVNQVLRRVSQQPHGIPADDPVNLESASLDEVLANAETWERVLRKLSVRAMPPQGAPRPKEPEYAAFTSWLAASLDRAWEGRSTPGRYVVHRLNRAEYANAVRDLLAVDIDVTDLLPTDGAEVRVRQHRDVAQNVAAAAGGIRARPRSASARMAVGDPQGEARDDRAFDQPRIQRRAGTSTACRSEQSAAPLSVTCFRLTPSTNCRADWSGACRKATPASKEMTRRTPSSSPWMAPKCIRLRLAVPRTTRCRPGIWPRRKPIIDKRMTGRVRVTAGPHDVGFTWKERPFQLQDVWEPSLRDSQEVHMVAGLPRLRTVSIDGPYNVTRRQRRAQPASGSLSAIPRELSLPRRARVYDTACADKILTNLARRAYRRPVTPADVEAPMSFYKRSRQSGGSFDDGIRAGVARVLSSPYFLYRIETRSDRRSAPAPRIRSATSSLPRACPSSRGAASRMRSCWTWPSPAGCGSQACSSAQVRRMLAESAPTPWSTISPGSGCSCAIWSRRSVRTC